MAVKIEDECSPHFSDFLLAHNPYEPEPKTKAHAKTQSRKEYAKIFFAMPLRLRGFA
ncbi:hypothetical protein L0337_24800 [candidate division KSB1 bacterium]|nr:hypothetical protein [candidate division KSB1 bacterium]